jgi:hypothetical protein
MNHLPGELVRRYARGDEDIPADQLWALEAHLESCGPCRELLAGHADAVTDLVDAVWSRLDVREPPPVRHKWLNTWAAPAALPWLGMSVLATFVAAFFDLLTRGGDGPSLVLLLAPVLPVLGVAAAWAKGMDPAYEIVSATPRSGLYLIFRRTSAVLVVLIPLLVAVGLPLGASPGLWLLPCLAFTVGTLALGGLVGMSRAAIGLGVAWVAFVAGPSVLTADLPAVLLPVSLPYWGLIIVGCAAVLAFRADTYARLG